MASGLWDPASVANWFLSWGGGGVEGGLLAFRNTQGESR